MLNYKYIGPYSHLTFIVKSAFKHTVYYMLKSAVNKNNLRILNNKFENTLFLLFK